MIFKDKLIRLPDGDNFSFVPQDSNLVEICYFNNGLNKKKLILGKIVRCEGVVFAYNGDFAKQLSNDHMCLCVNGNMSIVAHEEKTQ